ncbi:MAG TPA: transglutaminase domain-containing protein, partial [Candidatus Hydrogenedentes bacterium]|nr:transglutaminase domain-containing protein [Candidatus Hydrogenedentota bacterium]
LNPMDPMGDFIHETRRGHCELFASAMALMVRSLNIPARVVSGYHGGEWNEADRSYLVRASMAHLWVEVYFIDYGWVTFDPSPPVTIIAPLFTRRLSSVVSRLILRAKMNWYRYVVAYDQGRRISIFRRVQFALVGLPDKLVEQDEEDARPRRLPRPSPSTLLALPLVGLGGWFVVRRLRASREPTHLLTVDQARAVRLYKRLRRTLRRLGIDSSTMTAEEVEEACESLDLEAGLDEVRAVLTIYNEARFGDRPLPKERYEALRDGLRKLTPARKEA